MSKSEKSSKKAASVKAKQAKYEETVVPLEDNAVDTTADDTGKKSKKDKKDKGDKKEKKEKKDKSENQPRAKDADDAPASAPEPNETGEEPESRKSKKRKLEATTDGPVDGDVQKASEGHASKEKKPKKAKTSSVLAESDPQPAPEGNDKAATRFIVFIGNLPYTTTKDSVAKHFAKLPPVSIRAPMTNDNKKSKGFAFLEFDRYDYMKSCLKLYHHSSFDDGKSPARKINVELTAGGGGSKSEARKEKLKAKNEKLNEQRKRRAEYEAKEKARAEKKAKTGPGNGANAQPVDHHEPDSADNNGIHPARLARMQI